VTLSFLFCADYNLQSFIMSDFEDDMDVDAPPSKDTSIQFNSDNAAAKGKRIAADLPVEAGDNLPW
jgi:replication factor C subunit 3/5